MYVEDTRGEDECAGLSALAVRDAAYSLRVQSHATFISSFGVSGWFVVQESLPFDSSGVLLL